MNSLRTALEIVLPIENESILLCELDQRLKKKDIQQFNLMNSDLAYRELKVREDAETTRLARIGFNVWEVENFMGFSLRRLGLLTRLHKPSEICNSILVLVF